MKKLFISQPMRDKTDEEIIVEREKAVEAAKEMLGEDVEVIDSYFKGAPHDAPYWYCVGKSIELLSTVDVAFFCTGWEMDTGCRIEHICATEYGVQIIRSMTLEPFEERRVALTKYELADIKRHLIRAEEHYKKQLYFWEQLALRKDSKGELEYPNVVENIKFLRGLKWDVERLLKKIKKME